MLHAVLTNGDSIPFAEISGQRRNVQSSAPSSMQPLLLYNLGRSGSTWVTHLLGQHPELLAYRPFEQEPRIAGYWIAVFRSLADPRSYLESIAPEITDDTWWLGLRRSTPVPVAGFDPALERWMGSSQIEELLAFCQSRIDATYAAIAEESDCSNARYFIERGYGNGALATRLLREVYPECAEIFLVRDFGDLFCSMRAFSKKTGLLLFNRK